MSQVKKFQTGGSITIDGKKYEATPELIQNLSGYLSSYGDTAAPLAGLTSALQRGANVVYDSIGNTITGMDGQWAGVDDRGESRYDSNRSQWRKNWDATFNNDAHKWRKSLRLLSGFSGYGLSGNNPQTDALDNILGNETWFDYITNEDGTKTYSKDSAKNALIKQRLEKWSKGLPMTEEDFKKTYSLDSWYTPDKVAGIRAIYGNYATPEQWQARIAEIEERAQNNTLRPEDKQLLSAFNIIEGANPNAAADAEANKNKKRFIDAGFDYDKWSPYLTWNDAGYFNLNDDALEAFHGAFGGNGNYWFNDAFQNSAKYNPTGQWDFLNGHFVIGNRIYKQSDASDPMSDLSKILRRQGGFRDLNAAMQHNAANDLIEQLWGNEVGWYAPDGKYYSNWLDPNGNRYYRSVTGEYNWTGKNGNQQLISWVDANPELADEFGYYNPHFQITDEWGNRDLSAPEMETVPGLVKLGKNEVKPSKFDRRELYFSDSGNSEFDGRYIVGDAIDENGKVTGAAFWINPNNPNAEWLFESSKLNDYVEGMEGNAVRIPKSMSNILSQNPQFMRAFQNNPELRDRFIRLIAGSIGSAWNAGVANSTVKANEWEALGFSKEQAAQLAKESDKLSERKRLFARPRTIRRQERVVSKPQLHKTGGKVQKAAMGDMLGSKNDVGAAVTQTKTDKPIKDPAHFKNIGDGEKMQKEDWWELGALVGDAASLGLAFVPGAGTLSGITGIAGSTAGFKADVKRDGFQMGDLGNYLLNIGLDSTAFIGAGGLGKTAKILRSLKRSGKVINKVMKAAAVYGISNAAVDSWKKIQNGEGWSIRDVRNVVNALGGAVHMSRAGIKKPVKGKNTVEYPTINLKDGKQGNSIQLSESEFNAIQAGNPKDKGELAEILAMIQNKRRPANTPEITKEQIIDNYDLDEFVKTRKRFGLFGKDVSKIKGLDAKKKKGEWSWELIGKDPTKKQTREDYLAILNGQRRVKNPSKTITETVTEMAPAGKWEAQYGTEPIIATEHVPAGQFRPKLKPEVIPDVQGVPKEIVMVAGPNGVYAPSNMVPAIPISRQVNGIANAADANLPVVMQPMSRPVGTRRVVINEADKALPVPMVPISRTRTRTVPGGYRRIPRIVPTTSGIIYSPYEEDHIGFGGIKQYNTEQSPAQVVPYVSTRYTAYNPHWVGINQPIFKKGGKIKKAENGTEFDQNYLDSLLKGSISAAEQFRDKNSASWMTSGEDISKLAASKRWLDPITKPDTKLDEVLDPKTRLTTSYDPHSTIKNQIIKRNEENAEQAPAISHQGTIEGKPYSVDLNPIMNWARSLYSMHQSDKQLKNWLGRDRFQMQEFLLNAPRYINSGTGDAYRNLANSQRLHKNVTSDSTANWGEQQQQLQTALQSELQGHLADSQEFGKYIGGLAEFLNNNALKRTDIANQNRQYRVADNQADVLQKNTNIAEKSKFFDQAAYSTQDWYNRKRQAEKQVLALEDQQGSYQILDNLYRNKMNEWNQKYPTQEDQSKPQAQMELTWIKNFVQSQKNSIDKRVGTMMMAKGGKASKVTYSRDPYPELLIQNAKDSTKLVEKLNDSTIKLLLSIKPIHVS